MEMVFHLKTTPESMLLYLDSSFCALWSWMDSGWAAACPFKDFVDLNAVLSWGHQPAHQPFKKAYTRR
jgi:hypothetical protein